MQQQLNDLSRLRKVAYVLMVSVLLWLVSTTQAANLASKGVVSAVSSSTNVSSTNTNQTDGPAAVLAQFGADSAECQQDEKTNSNICTYSGNATFDQNTTHLHAPKIIVYKDAANVIYQIDAIGDKTHKAYYSSVIASDDEDKGNTDRSKAKQSKDINNDVSDKNNKNDYNVNNGQKKDEIKKDGKVVNATAVIIKLYPPKNFVTLSGDAEIIQDKDKVSGAYIEYDIKKQTILDDPIDAGRAVMLIYPNQ